MPHNHARDFEGKFSMSQQQMIVNNAVAGEFFRVLFVPVVFRNVSELFWR